MRALVMMVLLLCVVSAHAGSVYKYVDANGIVSYTDQYDRRSRLIRLKLMSGNRIRMPCNCAIPKTETFICTTVCMVRLL